MAFTIFSVFIAKLDFYKNKSHGTIVHQVGKLENVACLGLEINELTGTTLELASKNLRHLRLEDNALAGAIPKISCNLNKLKDL